MEPLSKQQAKSLLDEVVQHTFESLFFVETIPMTEADVSKIHGTEGLEITIDIKSMFSGQIRMYLSTESARRLAGQTMHAVGELNEEILTDTFSEILNTIGGRVAAAVAQSSCSFDLSIPTTKYGKISPYQDAQVKTCYQVEHGIVCFTFLLHKIEEVA